MTELIKEIEEKSEKFYIKNHITPNCIIISQKTFDDIYFQTGIKIKNLFTTSGILQVIVIPENYDFFIIGFLDNNLVYYEKNL